MLRIHRIIGLSLACVLVLGAPAAVSGKSAECRGRGHTKENPGKGQGRGCEDHEQPVGRSENSSEERGNKNGHPHGGPPGHDREAKSQPDPQGPPADPPGPPGTASDDADPPVHGGAMGVDIEVDVNRVVAEVGSTLVYEITIANEGTTTTPLTVVDDLPAEVEFLSSSHDVAAGGDGSVTWSIDEIRPGSQTTITWTGRVVRSGDLDAANIVSVEARGLDAPAVETHTYLATVQGVRMQRSPAEPDWGTHEERRVVFRSAGAHAPATTTPSAGQPSQLPRTGFGALQLALLAGLLLLGGLILIGRAKPYAAAAMMVVLVAAACTSEAPAPQTTPRIETPDSEDEVLGTRIQRKGGNNTTPAPEQTAPSIAADPNDDPADTAAPDVPATDTEPDDGVVRDVVLVEVPNDPPAPEGLGSIDGSNSTTVVWDETSREMLSATSSRTFGSDVQAEVLTSVTDGGNGMNAIVSLTNVTDDQRLVVDGHLVLHVQGPGGTDVQFESAPLDEILEPGDTVSADFLWALPSGSYFITASFAS